MRPLENGVRLTGVNDSRSGSTLWSTKRAVVTEMGHPRRVSDYPLAQLLAARPNCTYVGPQKSRYRGRYE